MIHHILMTGSHLDCSGPGECEWAHIATLNLAAVLIFVNLRRSECSLCCHLCRLCLLHRNRFCAVATSATATSHFTFLQFVQDGEAEFRSTSPAFNWRSCLKWASSVTWWHCVGCTSINWRSYRSHYSEPACHDSVRTKMIYRINPCIRLWRR